MDNILIHISLLPLLQYCQGDINLIVQMQPLRMCDYWKYVRSHSEGLTVNMEEAVQFGTNGYVLIEESDPSNRAASG